METVFLMETKLNFPALQATICLEVKEVDVLARNGTLAYQNIKVGFFLTACIVGEFCTLLGQPSSKIYEERR